MLASTSLRIFLVEIAQRENILLAKKRVAVEIHLGIQRHDLAVRRDDQRIDFRQRSVALFESAIKPLHDASHFPGQVSGDAERKRQTSALKGREPDHRIDGFLENLLRMPVGNLFNLNASFG